MSYFLHFEESSGEIEHVFEGIIIQHKSGGPLTSYLFYRILYDPWTFDSRLL